MIIELTEEEYIKMAEDSYKAGYGAAIEMLTKPKEDANQQLVFECQVCGKPYGDKL